MSCPYRIRVAFALSASNACQTRTTFVSNPRPWLFVHPSQRLFLFHLYSVRVMSASHPCHIHVWICARIRHGCDMNMTRATLMQGGHDTKAIRTFVRVSYFDCLKIIDMDKFRPGDRGGHDMDVIWTWTGRQGHERDTSLCHVCVSIHVCVNVALQALQGSQDIVYPPISQTTYTCMTLPSVALEPPYNIHRSQHWQVGVV